MIRIEIEASYDLLKINISDTFQVKANSKKGLDKHYRKLLKRYKLLNKEMKILESDINKKIAYQHKNTFRYVI